MQKNILIFALLYLLGISAIASERVSQKESKTDQFKSEIIVRTINNIKKEEDIDKLVDGCVKNNISAIIIACKQDEDDETQSGKVFYPSRIAPVEKGYNEIDLMRYLIQQAHKQKIKVKAWIPQFHDKMAFYLNPSWRMMTYKNGKIIPFTNNGKEYFVNPMHPGVQKYELSIIKEIVQNYDFDAIILDWVRFDNYDMDLGYYTRADFSKKFGYDPLEIDFKNKNPRRDQWNSYRSDAIAAYIQKVKESIKKIKPNLPLGIYILSPKWEELAQDPEKFAPYVDFVAPMCYFDDWGYTESWIYGKSEDAILPLVRKKVKTKEIIPAFDIDWSIKSYGKIFAHLNDTKTINWFEYGKWTPALLKKVGFLNELLKPSRDSIYY